ncbi:response regulator transcription factor [Nonomuraea sp. NPDC002799]
MSHAPEAEAAARHLIDILLRGSVPPDGSGVLLDLTVGETRCVITCDVGAAVTLTPREAEIARMVGRGFTNKEIARVLEISTWTVATHLRRIFSKLEVSTRAAMVARLLENKPVEESDLAM